jgi:hypothetical protein
MRTRARRWRLPGLVLAAALLLVLARGLLLVRYSPSRSDRYLWGAFHVHSTMSDGLLPLDEIAKAAKAARVSFILLSDHGAPHPEAATLDRTIDGVRFIGGSEVGTPEGHLIVSGVSELPRYHLPPFPPDAVDDVHEWGGIAIVTYPEDPVQRWKYWESDFTPDGIEVINVTSYFRASSLWQKLSWAVFSLFNRDYYIHGFESPAYALKRWDELLARGRVNAFYANNAHGGFPLTETRTVSVPSYETALGYVGLGIDPRYRDRPMEAIRRGDFFAVVRAAGEPEKFEIAESGGEIRVDLEGARYRARVDLKRNGVVVSSSETGSVRYLAKESGIYRAEVYLLDHPLLADDVPWILSNAIYVGTEPRPPAPSVLKCDVIDEVPLDELRVEKDDESQASLEPEVGGAIRVPYSLSQSTPGRVDRWVALALRKKRDLSSYKGIYVSGSAPEPMRYWVEVRAGEDEHYASVKLGPKGLSTIIPWDRFFPTVGERRAVPLADIDALFLTVNTSSARTGFSSELTLSKLGFCR